MPPQLTTVTSGTEGDAARRRLDLSIVLSLLKQYWRVFQQRRQGQQVTLQDLSDRELMDIGLTRGEIDYLTPQRAIDAMRDSTRYLLSRGGM
jgi:uncharacterized protein YjiS (DUF1127 family)